MFVVVAEGRQEERWWYPPDYVSAESLAYRLDCSRSTIDAYVRLGLLPKPETIGNLQRWLMSVVQEKTGKKLWIAMHRDLRLIAADTPRRATTILTNKRGLPWTSDGFRASWTKELARPVMAPIRDAGLVFHGLRKSAVVFLLEAGCTDAEVSAITGQSRQMVEHYARQVNQKKLVASAVLKWETADGRNA